MSGSVVLLHLAGAVALLLFATRMVKTGVERAYGNVLRKRLRSVMSNPLMAVVTGAALAVALQSSTAVTLLVAGFAGSGIVSGLAGQLAVRGAEVGSAIVVRLLTFDLSLIVPIFLAAGTVMFMATEHRTWLQIGRILIGIGLLVLSLQMIGQASEPMRDSRLLPIIVNYLAGDQITAFLIAALVTWLFHSSIAAVLLLVTLASRGLVPADLGIVMVLGVNLGSSVIAPLLTRKSDVAVRVVPIGNLVMRGAGSILLLVLFEVIRPDSALIGTTSADRIVNAHIVFNVVILLAGVPLSRLVFAVSERLVAVSTSKGPAPSLSTIEISALQEDALDTPSVALADATREVVRICETVELMLTRVIGLYDKADQMKIDALSRLDDRLDKRHAAIKLYLARLTTRRLSEAEAVRCQELIGASVKLEQVGDIVVRNLLAHVQKKLDRGLSFTEDGWQELLDFHASVMANARLAFSVLVSRDPETARRLVERKDQLRLIEQQASRSHFARLREGAAKSVETSSIHLDTIRDLKQINSLLASMVYPILEEAGLLSKSRLRAV